MVARVLWLGSALLLAIATLARVEAMAVQGEPARPALLGDGRGSSTQVTLEGFVLAPDGFPAS